MNLRSVARALHRLHPTWWFLLPDLRAHGKSSSLQPPHTLESCAADVLRLEQSFGVSARVRMGHSFGGKVVLATASADSAALVLLDSLAENTRKGESSRSWMSGLVDTLGKVPTPLKRRDELAGHLGPYGVDPKFVGWMSTNLVVTANADYRWRFNLPVISELLESYWEKDLWPLLQEEAERASLLYGERSQRFDDDAVARLDAMGLHSLVKISKSGHWIHVDNPEETLQGLSAILRDVE